MVIIRDLAENDDSEKESVETLPRGGCDANGDLSTENSTSINAIVENRILICDDGDSDESRLKKAFEKRRRYELLQGDVLSPILQWLPKRSVLRLRSVCTEWDSIMKDPNFRQRNKKLLNRQRTLFRRGNKGTKLIGNGDEGSRLGELLRKIPEFFYPLILVRLPVKSLMRFKAVCIAWRELIISDVFENMHLAVVKEKDAEILVIKHEREKWRTVISMYSNSDITLISDCNEVDLDAIDESGCTISWPCNGLLAYQFCGEEGTFLLHNPSIKDYKIVPPIPLIDTDHISVIKYGLGYDNVAEDYKLVVMYKRHDEQTNKYVNGTSVYSLNFNQWRQIMVDINDLDDPEKKFFADDRVVQGVPLNGSLNWVVTIQSKPIILSFDMITEGTSRLALPDCASKTEVTFLSLCNDRLAAYIYESGGENKFSLNLWIRKEGEWHKYICNLFGMSENRRVLPLLQWDNDKMLIYINVTKSEDEKVLLCQDIKASTSYQTGIVCTTYGNLEIRHYKESLVRLSN